MSALRFIRRGVLLTTSVLVGSATMVAPAATTTEVAGSAGSYLAREQLSAEYLRTPRATADGIAEVLGSVVASGIRGGPIERALQHIARGGPERAEMKGAYAARIVIGLRTVGRSTSVFEGYDYLKRLKDHYDPTTGAYDTSTVYAQAISMIGLVAGGASVPSKAVDYLRSQRCPSGGFSYTQGCMLPADTDTTAMSIQALIAAGVPPSDEVITGSRTFLSSIQRPDGGFSQEPHKAADPTNANSTGLALSAIAALKEDPTQWARFGPNPIDALMQLRHEGGGFKYQGTDDAPNAYATVQAIPGILGLAQPMPAMPVTLADPAPGSSAASTEVATRSAAPEASPVSPEAPSLTGSSAVEDGPPVRVLGRPIPGEKEDTGTRPPLVPVAAVLLGLAATGVGSIQMTRGGFKLSRLRRAR